MCLILFVQSFSGLRPADVVFRDTQKMRTTVAEKFKREKNYGHTQLGQERTTLKYVFIC